MLKQLQTALVLPRMIMTVAAVNADGTVTASSASGHTIRAIGSGTVGGSHLRTRRQGARDSTRLAIC